MNKRKFFQLLLAICAWRPFTSISVVPATPSNKSVFLKSMLRFAAEHPNAFARCESLEATKQWHNDFIHIIAEQNFSLSHYGVASGGVNINEDDIIGRLKYDIQRLEELISGFVKDARSPTKCFGIVVPTDVFVALRKLLGKLDWRIETSAAHVIAKHQFENFNYDVYHVVRRVNDPYGFSTIYFLMS